MTFEIKGIKYTVQKSGWNKTYLIPDDEEKYAVIPILSGNIGSLSYLNRSFEVSEAIREWEKKHNTKLSPRF